MMGSDPSTFTHKVNNNSSDLNFLTKKEEIIKYFFDRGFCLIPADDKKVPLIKWESYQKEKPSWEQIIQWKKEFHDPNFAVICGPVSGNLTILDFEDEKDAIAFFGKDKFDELKKTTIVVSTPHGGIHVPLIAKGKIPRRQTKIFGYEHEVDLLGEGGYSLLPGSVLDHSKCKPEKNCDHKSKGEYKIISTSTDILEAEDIENFIKEKAKILGWKVKLTKEENKENDQDIDKIIDYLKAKDRKFSMLMEGNFDRGQYPSRSEAEEALLTILVDQLLSDEQIKKIMDQSKIGKWQEEKDDYKNRSIQRAREWLREKRLEEINRHEEIQTTKWIDDDGKLEYDVIVEDIRRAFNNNIFSDATFIYVWDKDHYHNEGKSILAKKLADLSLNLSPIVIEHIIKAVQQKTFKKKEEIASMELPREFLPVRNGILNWKTGELKPHSPDYFYTERLGVEYDPEAFPEGFVKYSLSLFENNYTEMFKMWEDLALAHFRGNPYQIVSIWMGQSKDPSGLVSGGEGKTTTAEKLFGQKYFGRDLFTKASLQSLSKSDFEFFVLRGKWLHVASLDESGYVRNYSGLIEQLRDPFMQKPVKNRPEQLLWENTAYNILIGNMFPKATANTKAFYRSIQKIVYWRKPMKNEWEYVEGIDDKEKSGLLNLSIALMRVIELRGKPYGLFDLNEIKERYMEISDSLSMLLLDIFEKDKENEIDQDEAINYVFAEGELRGLVMESLTKKKLTIMLKDLFGASSKDTTTRTPVKSDDGKITKTTTHKYSYIGIKIKEKIKSEQEKTEQETISEQEQPTGSETISDTLGGAVQDYLLSIPEGGYYRLSEILLTRVYKKLLLIIEEGISTSDKPITPLLDALKDPNKSNPESVSEILKGMRDPNNQKDQKPRPALEDGQNFLKSLEDNLRSKGISINEQKPMIDEATGRFLIYVLEPYRPDDIMKELGFSFVNQSKDGVLYEKPFNIQALQGGN